MADDTSRRPLSALPSPRARALAFAAIVIAGLAGGFIGYGFTSLQCTGDCATQGAVAALIGAVLAAAGTAVVAVLALRAMGEWRAIGERDAIRNAARAANGENAEHPEQPEQPEHPERPGHRRSPS